MSKASKKNGNPKNIKNTANNNTNNNHKSFSSGILKGGSSSSVASMLDVELPCDWTVNRRPLNSTVATSTSTAPTSILTNTTSENLGVFTSVNNLSQEESPYNKKQCILLSSSSHANDQESAENIKKKGHASQCQPHLAAASLSRSSTNGINNTTIDTTTTTTTEQNIVTPHPLGPCTPLCTNHNTQHQSLEDLLILKKKTNGQTSQEEGEVDGITNERVKKGVNNNIISRLNASNPIASATSSVQRIKNEVLKKLSPAGAGGGGGLSNNNSNSNHSISSKRNENMIKSGDNSNHKQHNNNNNSNNTTTLSQNNQNQHSILEELDTESLLSRLPYRKMLSDIFGGNLRGNLKNLQIPYVTRVYEEAFMREPLNSSERECATGKQCECMNIDRTQPFVAVEFLLPGEPLPRTPHLCVLCCRAITQQLYYDVIFDKTEFPGTIQRFGNIHSQPGIQNLCKTLLIRINYTSFFQVNMHLMLCLLLFHQLQCIFYPYR